LGGGEHIRRLLRNPDEGIASETLDSLGVDLHHQRKFTNPGCRQDGRCICSETQVYLAQEFCFVFCCLYSRFFCMSFVADLVQPIVPLAPSPRASSPTARCEYVRQARPHLTAPCTVLD